MHHTADEHDMAKVQRRQVEHRKADVGGRQAGGLRKVVERDRLAKRKAEVHNRQAMVRDRWVKQRKASALHKHEADEHKQLANDLHFVN